MSENKIMLSIRGLPMPGLSQAAHAQITHLSVVLQRCAVQRVEHGVTSAVGSTGAAVRLASLTVVEALTSEGALINLPLVWWEATRTMVTSSAATTK